MRNAAHRTLRWQERWQERYEKNLGYRPRTNSAPKYERAHDGAKLREWLQFTALGREDASFRAWFDEHLTRATRDMRAHSRPKCVRFFFK